MSHKIIGLIVALFLLIVVGMFGFAYLKKVEAPAALPEATPTTAGALDTYGITRIEAKHFFSKGVHTIVGELSMPTACDLLTGTSTVASTVPPIVIFDFSVINNSRDCALLPTAARFKVEAVAGNDATLKARFMGKDVDLNLTEAAAGETPDSYEMFIKG